MSEGSVKLRWFSFGLRTMFAMVTVAAIAMAWVGWQAKFVRDRKTFLNRTRPEQWSLMMYHPDTIYPSVPFWRRWLGDDAEIDLTLCIGSTDADMEEAKKLFPEAWTITVEQPEWRTQVAPLKARPTRRLPTTGQD